MSISNRWTEEQLAQFVNRGHRAQQVLKKLPIDEKGWQATVDGIFTLYGWRHYHTRISKQSAEGFSDSVGLRQQRIVVAELKINDELPTAKQILWLDAWEAAGAEVYVWYPDDVDYVHHVLGPVMPRSANIIGPGMNWRRDLLRKKCLAADTIDAIARKVRIGG